MIDRVRFYEEDLQKKFLINKLKELNVTKRRKINLNRDTRIAIHCNSFLSHLSCGFMVIIQLQKISNIHFRVIYIVLCYNNVKRNLGKDKIAKNT